LPEAAAHQDEAGPPGARGKGEGNADGIEVGADRRRQQQDAAGRQQDAKHVDQPARCQQRNGERAEKLN
jgi:hypothetical protein